MMKIDSARVKVWLKEHALELGWGLCVFIMTGPALIGWLLRLTVFATGCHAGADACVDEGISEALRILLSLSWAVAGSIFWLLFFAFLAALAAFFRRKPLTGTLSFFLLPLVASVLPLMLVYVTRYDGCQINPDGVGDCVLWGTRMGWSFHSAASMQDRLFDLMPTLAGLTVMLGMLGWFFAHPNKRRPKPNEKMAMEMRQFTQPPEE